MGTQVQVSVLTLGSSRAPKTPAAKEVMPSPCLHAYWHPHMHTHQLIHTLKKKAQKNPPAATICVDVHMSHVATEDHMNALDLCCYLWPCWCPRPNRQALPPRAWHPLGSSSGQDYVDKWVQAVAKSYVGLWPCGCQYLCWCTGFCHHYGPWGLQDLWMVYLGPC